MDKPRCLSCGKPLRRYSLRDQYPEQQWGDYGDGHVCGLRCGYAWTMMFLRRHPDFAERLHSKMQTIMTDKVKP